MNDQRKSQFPYVRLLNLIESPHDFSEVNIGTVYTSRKANFAKRIHAIIAKRLENAGLPSDPHCFFTVDEKQEARRKEIWQDLKEGNTDQHIQLRGDGPAQTRDLAQRYATPALMRELNRGRSAHTYSYAGMQSMTDLSAGVVRWFLEPAGRMFDTQESTTGEVPESIPVSVQNDVLSNWSREFREKLNIDPGEGDNNGDEEASLQSVGHSKEDYEKLANLLDGVGGWCRQRLLDKIVSEQRVFSFALNDRPSDALTKILDLGVRLGYLQKADLASKSAYGGRRPRYILSRRLGPYYKLDVSGYAAHLSVMCPDLEIAMVDPTSFIKQRTKQLPEENLQQKINFGESE